MDTIYSYPRSRSYVIHTLVAALLAFAMIAVIVLYEGGTSERAESAIVAPAPLAAAPGPQMADMLFLEQNLILPSARGVVPAAGIDAMRFLEENLFLPSAVSPAAGVDFDGMRFLEENLMLPVAAAGGQTQSFDGLLFLEENTFLPVSPGAIPPAEEDVAQPVHDVTSF